MKDAGLVEALEDVPIDLDDPTRIIKIGTHLETDDKWNLIKFLRTNNDVFA